MNLFGLLILTITLNGPADGVRDPFRHGAVAPPDVDLYLHVDGAKEILDTIQQRPIADSLLGIVRGGKMAVVWNDVARMAHAKPGELFDLMLGESFTILTRPADEGGEWALITEMDRDTFKMLLTRLHAPIELNRGKVAVARLPEFDLKVAHDGVRFAAGPAGRAGLLDDVIKNLGRRNRPVLRNRADFREARKLGGGRVAVFLRHDDPIGGWTAAVGDVTADDLRIRHASHFKNSPFDGAVTVKAVDLSIVECFSEFAFLSFAQPLQISGGFAGEFLRVVLIGDAIGEKLTGALGDRIITVIGEIGERMLDADRETVAPALGWAIEMRGAWAGFEEIDRVMIALARNLHRQGGISAEKIKLERADDDAMAPRRIDLTEPTAMLLPPGFPGAEDVSLNWSIASGVNGRWWVVASNPDHLGDMVRVLENDAAPAGPMVAQLNSRGRLNGHRVGRHLRELLPQLELIAKPEYAERITLGVGVLADVVDGIENVDWVNRRPELQRLVGDIVVHWRAATRSKQPPEGTRVTKSGKR